MDNYQQLENGYVLRLSDLCEIPPDGRNSDYQLYLAQVAEGYTPLPAPPPTPEQIIAELTRAVQDHLDARARAAGYDDIVSACSYAGAANPFQAESQAFVAWRGNVWAACIAIMDEVTRGVRAVQTEAELISLLPKE